MKTNETKNQLADFLKKWSEEEYKNPIGRTLNGEPKTLKVQCTIDFRNAVEDCLNRLKKDYPDKIQPKNGFVYPMSLYADIFGDIAIASEIKDTEGINWALNNIITPREKEIILLNYKDKQTIKTIAKQFSITTERIRQIITKALRKLRQPRVAGIIREGFDVVEANNKLHKSISKENEHLLAQLQQIKENKEILRKLINGLTISDEETSKVQDLLNQNTNIKSMNHINDSIEDLGLSVRAVNCLHRNGYTTILDLINTTQTELYKINNLGRKTLEEIVTTLAEYGIDLAY